MHFKREFTGHAKVDFLPTHFQPRFHTNIDFHQNLAHSFDVMQNKTKKYIISIQIPLRLLKEKPENNLKM